VGACAATRASRRFLVSDERSFKLTAVIADANARLVAIVCAWSALGLAAVSGSARAQPPPAAEAAEAASSDAALDRVLASEEAVNDEAAEGKPLALYGFADCTFRTFLLGENNRWTSFYPRQSRFMVGNLNVYLSKEISARVRSMAEVRFLYLPNGVEQLDGLKVVRTDTSVVDNAEFDHHLTWGGIQIVRAWVEYTFHPLLTARVGQWLTPYGIWNSLPSAVQAMP
jgi:hypothetical protein